MAPNGSWSLGEREECIAAALLLGNGKGPLCALMSYPAAMTVLVLHVLCAKKPPPANRPPRRTTPPTAFSKPPNRVVPPKSLNPANVEPSTSKASASTDEKKSSTASSDNKKASSKQKTRKGTLTRQEILRAKSFLQLLKMRKCKIPEPENDPTLMAEVLDDEEEDEADRDINSLVVHQVPQDIMNDFSGSSSNDTSPAPMNFAKSEPKLQVDKTESGSSMESAPRAKTALRLSAEKVAKKPAADKGVKKSDADKKKSFDVKTARSKEAIPALQRRKAKTPSATQNSTANQTQKSLAMDLRTAPPAIPPKAFTPVERTAVPAAVNTPRP